MKWKKLGHIFSPDKNYTWMNSYASYPWAEQEEGDIFKIYFSTRDKENKSSIGAILCNLKTLQVVNSIDVPLISKGEIGTFDDSGVSMSSIIMINNNKYLYYLGWNILKTVPWKNTIGVAIQNSKGIFERHSKAPILGIHHHDPFTLTYPFVLKDEDTYKMWYGSSLFWGPEVENTIHVIKYATSSDGLNWQRNNITCIAPQHEGEFAIVKPFVIKEENIYKMWYSYRVYNNYKMGYAESSDGIKWTRKDEEVGLDVSKEGWDSEMICYPFIFDYQGKRYMLYNGNGYGKTGFGLAVLEN